MHAETHARTTPPSSLLPPQSFSFLLSFSNLHPLPLQHVEKLVTVLGMGWGRGREKGGGPVQYKYVCAGLFLFAHIQNFTLCMYITVLYDTLHL